MTTARVVDKSLAALTDSELTAFVEAMGKLVTQSHQAGEMRLSHAYAGPLVAGCEEQDRRKAAVEEMRIAIDGPDCGELWDGTQWPCVRARDKRSTCATSPTFTPTDHRKASNGNWYPGGSYSSSGKEPW